MPPEERAELLYKTWSNEKCLEVTNQMINHYIGTNIEHLWIYWQQVEEEINNIIAKKG